MGEVVRYSEAFKRQVLREIGEGKFSSIGAAQRAYGIRGACTIQNWMRKLGHGHLLPKVIRVEKPKEVDEKKQLQRRVRELEKALVDAELDLRLERAWCKLACESAGIEDVDAFKKKHAVRL